MQMEELSKHIYFNANNLARRASVLADRQFKEYGFSGSYAFIIIAVQRNEGLSQKQVSDVFKLAPSTVTRFVDKLVKKGLMERSQQGKEILLTLTVDGVNMAIRLEDDLKILDAEIVEKLGDKYLYTLNRMLDHGIQLLEKDD
jgi:DNA-binding MarR family transcriptional regulator